MLTRTQLDIMINNDFKKILALPIITTRQLEGLKHLSDTGTGTGTLSVKKKKIIGRLFDKIEGSKNKPREARLAKMEAETSHTNITQMSFTSSFPDELIETIMKSLSFYKRLFYLSVSKQFAKVINQMEFREEYIHFKNSFVILVNNLDQKQIKNYTNLKSLVGTTLKQEAENKNAIINREYDLDRSGLMGLLTVFGTVISIVISNNYFDLDS